MGWMLLATTGIAINNAFIRHLTSTGLSPIEIAFFVNVFGVLAMTPFFLYHGPGLLRTRRFGLHLLRAACFFTAMVLLYIALASTPLALVAALGFTMPIITTILAIVFFHEVVRLRHWIAILVGFSGTFVILRPGLAIVELGSLLVLLAACFLSIMTILAKLLARTESSLTITAYTRLLPTPIAFVAALFVWDWPTWPQLGILVLAGIIGTAASLAIVQAVKIGETNVVMPMDFSKLVWASLIGFLVFAEVPTVYTWIGGVMIFSSALYIAYREGEVARTM
jgi:drug/metabolite transporter (DMT)-like permease